MKSMVFGSLLLLLLTFSNAEPLSKEQYEHHFIQWMLKHHKVYTPSEFFHRFQVFQTNFDFIRNHNAGNHSYSVELNKFADLTQAEFKQIYLGFANNNENKSQFPPLQQVQAYPNGALDWTQKGAVTGVKDQGQCGACWAFSTTGAVEGAVAIKHNILTPLSEQQLIDCSGAYGNNGCFGGLMTRAFMYLMNNGLCSERDYPYTAHNGLTCKASSCTEQPYTKLQSFYNVQHSEEALGAAVDYAPISVAIEADQSGFQFYSGGVFSGTCGQNLDHGVLLVGYGYDASAGMNYWKVKNSWGTNWGEQGYIRMIRNYNECGIANEASYPVDS